MSAETETTIEEEVRMAHAEDAKKFFAPEPEKSEEAAPPKEEAKKEAPKQEAKKAGPLDSLFKKKAEEAPKQEAEPKGEEEDPFKDLPAPDPKSKHAPDWAKAKEVTKTFQKKAADAENRAAQLEKELGELKQKAPNPEADAAVRTRLAQLEEENKKYSERLKVLDYSSHPEFESKFVLPQREARAALVEVLKQEEVADVDVDRLLSLRGKALATEVSKILGNLTEFNKAGFGDAVRKYVAAADSAQGALKNAGEFLAKSKEAAQANARAAFDSVSKSFALDLAEVSVDEKATPEEKAEAEKYNSELSAIGKKAEKLAFSPVGDKEVAEMAHKAASLDFVMGNVLPRFTKMVEKEIGIRDSRIAELEEKVAAISKAKPKISEGASDSEESKSSAEPQDHLSAARAYFSSQKIPTA